MIYISHYPSPIGKLFLASKNNELIGLWIEGQKYFLGNLTGEIQENDGEEILLKTKLWLDDYFHGQKPLIVDLALAPVGSDFRLRVWDILCQIPYGEVTTYGSIAKTLAKQLGKKSMSAQAVGNAVGHNPISIIIPCHRVVGSNGSLTGYAGGLANKIELLSLEKVDMSGFYVPTKGSAL